MGQKVRQSLPGGIHFKQLSNGSGLNETMRSSFAAPLVREERGWPGEGCCLAWPADARLGRELAHGRACHPFLPWASTAWPDVLAAASTAWRLLDTSSPLLAPSSGSYSWSRCNYGWPLLGARLSLRGPALPIFHPHMAKIQPPDHMLDTQHDSCRPALGHACKAHVAHAEFGSEKHGGSPMLRFI